MNSMKDALLKSMSPRAAIRLKLIDNKVKDKDVILKMCENTLKYSYETILDIENNVIYIGKRNG